MQSATYFFVLYVHLLDFPQGFHDNLVFELFSSKLIVKNKVDAIFHFLGEIMKLHICQLVLRSQILESKAGAQQVHALNRRAVIPSLDQEVLHDRLDGGRVLYLIYQHTLKRIHVILELLGHLHNLCFKGVKAPFVFFVRFLKLAHKLGFIALEHCLDVLIYHLLQLVEILLNVQCAVL